MVRLLATSQLSVWSSHLAHPTNSDQGCTQAQFEACEGGYVIGVSFVSPNCRTVCPQDSWAHRSHNASEKISGPADDRLSFLIRHAPAGGAHLLSPPPVSCPRATHGSLPGNALVRGSDRSSLNNLSQGSDFFGFTSLTRDVRHHRLNPCSVPIVYIVQVCRCLVRLAKGRERRAYSISNMRATSPRTAGILFCSTSQTMSKSTPK